MSTENPRLDPDRLTEVLQSRESIPSELVDFVRLCISEGVTNRLIEELLLDELATSDGLNEFFSRASHLSGLQPSQVLAATGFSSRDLDPSRIESAIAQLRAIFYMDREGFSRIRLIPAQGQKAADMVAERAGELYAAEVATSIYDAEKRFSPEELASWAFSRWESEGKKRQIESTSEEHTCARGVFICVISTKAAAALQTHPQFMEAAQLAWGYIGSPTTIHVSMVTGRETLGYGMDDAVCPKWPGIEHEDLNQIGT
jgi:hypothetical protein